MLSASLLLQPQRVRRSAAVTADQALVEDLLALMTRTARDQARGGRVVEVVGEALTAVARRLEERAADGAARARRRLAEWADAPGGLVETMQGVELEGDDPVALVRQIQGFVAKLAESGERPPVAALRRHVELLVDVVQSDLGLSATFLVETVEGFLDDLVARLRSMPPEADAEVRANRQALAAALGRVVRRLEGRIMAPELDPEEVVQALLEFLRRPALARLLEKAACVNAGVSVATDVAGELLALLPAGGFGGGTVGAAAAANGSDSEEETYGWYASWLLGTRDRPGGLIPLQILLGLAQLPFPGDDVVVERSAGRIVRRNRLRGDDVLYPVEGEVGPGGELDWTFAAPFRTASERYATGVVSPEALEATAFHTAWAIHYGETVAHLFSVERGDWLSNLLFILTSQTLWAHNLAAKSPLHGWIQVLLRFVSYFGGSWQGIHTRAEGHNFASFWSTLLGADALEANIYLQTGNAFRDALLSLLTLINHRSDRTGSERLLNGTVVDGLVAGLTGILVGQVLVRIVPDENYTVDIGRAPGETLGPWLGGSVATAVVGAAFGTAVGFAIANLEETDFAVLGKQIGLASLQAVIAYWPSLFLSKEGETDDGRYNPRGADFPGYPDRDSSPYRLPYDRALCIQCAQGNQGIWSHNNFSNQRVYSYDFALDQDEPILAARPGTVVDYFDWVPNDESDTTAMAGAGSVGGQTQNSRVNFITIRHDLEEADDGTLSPVGPIAGHDRDQGDGVTTTTYAEYLHGRTDSVRDAFAARGVAANAIIGQQVRRGQAIMASGDTGRSFYNHLHMHVRPGPAAPSPPDGMPVQRSTLVNRSVPFVFSDVRDDGRPRSLDWYVSSNREPA